MSFVNHGPDGHSTRNHFVEPPSLLQRLSALLPHRTRSVLVASGKQALRPAAAAVEAYKRERRRNRRAGTIITLLRVTFTLPNLLLLMWVVTLWWGERSVFKDSVRDCEWEKWENWPENSEPIHAVLIADPQLVDAHTYPGRPWPLSSLTVFYSDLYLYRSYSLLQQHLRPDATLFLGDLFDGGREWGTDRSTSPIPRYKNYGNKVWMKEYRRFAKIFLDRWKLGGSDSAANSGERKLIASLPGNHDIGFGNGVQLPVVERFRTFFGEENRIDIIGNHTFISVDTVSLSAMDQLDPSTGSSAGNDDSDMEKIWKPTEEFLNSMETLKGKAIQEELLLLKGDTEKYQSPHTVADIYSAAKPTQIAVPSTADFPSVVLSHVPFYREPGTPCGPLREHFPPSSTDPLPEKDEQNALRIAGGYQYQNVLTELISSEVATKAGPLTQIFSGDDHDYCEVTHREFNGAPRETTVKSMSLAMGVRRPGFQMVSLWNPIDPDSGKQTYPSSSPTLQDHPCILPDQVSIFIQYAYVFVFTLLVLLVRALSFAFRASDTLDDPSEPILPLANRSPNNHTSSSVSSKASTSYSSPSPNDRRSTGRRATVSSRTGSSSPTVQIVGASGTDDSSRNFWRADAVEKPRDMPPTRASISPERDIPVRGLRRSIFIFRREFVSSMKRVCVWAFVWYLWLVWTW